MSQRIIRPDAHLIQEFTYQQEQQLPVDKPVVQYIRQSTMGQVKHNLQSKIQQDAQLAQRLIARGFSDIIKIEADQGKSGQKRRDERTGLDHLYTLAEQGKVGAIAFFDASRLWRDQTHVWYNDFIQLVIKHTIPVITYSRVYWPNNQQDMDALREDFRQAAYQLRHIYEKVNPARLQAVEMGLSYGGHCVPLGFTIAETEDRKSYVIYEDHARLIRWLFKRYRELGGNLSRLGHEIQTMGFTFPAFSGIEKIPHVGLSFDGTGYPLRTRGALQSILTNPAYIGWYVFNGVVVSKQAHDAIVPLDDFMFAYSRLSDVTLDGQENENKPKVDRRYGIAVNALLEGILVSDDIPVYVVNTGNYVARLQNAQRASDELVISVDALDKAFIGALIPVLVALEQRHKNGVKDTLHDQLVALQAEKQEEVISLDSALATIDKAIRGYELDKQSAREQGFKPGLDEANKQLKRLYVDRGVLEYKASHADTEAQELAECDRLHMQAVDRWDSLPFEKQRRFVKLLIQSANMTEASPHILKIDIALRPHLDASMTGYIYRAYGCKSQWTPDEMFLLRNMYPHADRADILKALPYRSWDAIRQQAIIMGLSRSTRLNTSGIADNLPYADIQLRDSIQGVDFPYFPLDKGDFSVWTMQGDMLVKPFVQAVESNQGMTAISGKDDGLSAFGLHYNRQ